MKRKEPVDIFWTFFIGFYCTVKELKKFVAVHVEIEEHEIISIIQGEAIHISDSWWPINQKQQSGREWIIRPMHFTARIRFLSIRRRDDFRFDS